MNRINSVLKRINIIQSDNNWNNSNNQIINCNKVGWILLSIKQLEKYLLQIPGVAMDAGKFPRILLDSIARFTCSRCLSAMGFWIKSVDLSFKMASHQTPTTTCTAILCIFAAVHNYFVGKNRQQRSGGGEGGIEIKREIKG